MYVNKYFYFKIIESVYIFEFITSFYVLPFETIYVKDETINNTNDFITDLMQNELYVNLSMGTPKQDFKAIIKMDKYGFLLYEKALDFSLSTTYEQFDEELKVNWITDSIILSSKDYYYLPSFNSYKNFEDFVSNKNKKKYNIIKTNKLTFLRVQHKPEKENNFNKIFYNYGLIGVKYNTMPYFNAPEFILGLNDTKEMKAKCFSFKFESCSKNGFADNSNNKGYFIFGEEVNDDESEKEKIKYTKIQASSGLAWDIKFDKIFTKINNNNENKNNFTEYIKETISVGFVANYPYIIGTKEFYEYINETFFNNLVKKNLCYCNNLINNGKYLSYACDSKSQYFMDYLNNNFPDIVFVHRELGVNFTLNKNDLFAYNSFNNSDTNLYFLILYTLESRFYIPWQLGIPFLKKYRLSFNYESKMIGYYANDGNIIEKNKNNFKLFNSTIFKIIVIIILSAIIFILGMKMEKYLQKNRKKKANELDDNYEYESYEDKNNEHNNNDKIGINSIN